MLTDVREYKVVNKCKFREFKVNEVNRECRFVENLVCRVHKVNVAHLALVVTDKEERLVYLVHVEQWDHPECKVQLELLDSVIHLNACPNSQQMYQLRFNWLCTKYMIR